MNHQRVGPKEKIKRGQIKLTDAFGQRARQLSDPKMNLRATKPHVMELEEARAEWRRRHPKLPLRESV
jgi:hypothetical protein